ncbi:hypothetical protein AVBRAN12654_06980 [Campylobacter sp. RM12654]|uniref:hypothetical protein n=1 Tax=Campylobacter sp. RM12654 TaxID=2735738 RepID=UPI003014F0EB|nr:hypothetical protein [Campylobacter sp. RM12654]
MSDFIILENKEQALKYLESLKDTMSENIYQKIQMGLHKSYDSDDEGIITEKSLRDHIEYENLIELGKTKEADVYKSEKMTENMNIYLKAEGIVR